VHQLLAWLGGGGGGAAHDTVVAGLQLDTGAAAHPPGGVSPRRRPAALGAFSSVVGFPTPPCSPVLLSPDPLLRHLLPRVFTRQTPAVTPALAWPSLSLSLTSSFGSTLMFGATLMACTCGFLQSQRVLSPVWQLYVRAWNHQHITHWASCSAATAQSQPSHYPCACSELCGPAGTPTSVEAEARP
jgi:hypothetical protein